MTRVETAPSASEGGGLSGIVHRATTVGAGFGVWGYAVDPDTAGSIDVHIYPDGTFAGSRRADIARDDRAARLPGFGAAHAFGVTVAATPGSHHVCVYAINTPWGVNPSLGYLTAVRQ